MQPQQQYIPPVQQPQQPANFDFTQQNQPQQPMQSQQQPQTPVQPDPALTALQSDIAEIKAALSTQQPTAPVAPAPPDPQAPARQYDEWGAVFQDTAKQAEQIVEQKLAEVQDAQTQAMTQAQQQEQQNQQFIDGTITQLRNAGYLPAVTNQFDANDQGKQAENELLGYAISLGSTDLVRAAQELKFRHDAGFKFDYQSKNFVQTQQPSNDPNAGMFGNLPMNPDGQPQPQQFQTQQPQFQQPVGPQNPYMMQSQVPQYPAGFNAPVSNGASYQGTQGAVPALKNLRQNSYDALVEQFNRTQ